MNSYEIVILVFTGVIAISTAIYTYYSHKLWKATSFCSDIARYNSFMSYLKLLSDEGEKHRRDSPETAEFIDHLGSLIMEVGVQRVLEDIDLEKDRQARDYFSKIEGMFRGRGIDPHQVPWLRTILEKMNK